MKRVVCVLLLVVLTSAVARADMVSLSVDRDNYLMGPGSSNITGYNYGDSKDLVPGQGDVHFASCTGILSFDVSTLPAGTVNAITLRLHSNSWVDTLGVGILDVNVNAMLASNKDWVEGTGATDVGATQAGSCFDWKDSSGTVEEPLNVAWASGGPFSSSDYSATVLSTVTVSESDVDTYVDFNFAGTPTELTILIDGWRTDNAGLVVSATPTSGIILMRFDTSDNETAEYSPELIIDISQGANPIPGDANDDGVVDVSDLGILATNYGAGGGFGWGDADFTGDGFVDVSDLGILATNYGNTAAAAAQAVPEPATWVVFLGAVLSLIVTRRR